MELNEFRPYKLNSIASAFDIHLRQLLHLLHRMKFTENEYVNRKVQFNRNTIGSLIRKLIISWATILSLNFTYLPKSYPIFNGFNMVFEETLGIKNINPFKVALQITFIIIEYISLYSLWTQMRYRNTKLECVFNLRANTDRQVSQTSQQIFIQYFCRYSYLAGLCNKVAALGLAAFGFRMIYFTFHLYQSGHINELQLIISIYYSFILPQKFFNVMFIIFSLLVGLFFIVKIFHNQMIICLIFAKSFSTLQKEHLFFKLFNSYIILHRNIVNYNRTVKEYIFAIDFGSKFLSTLLVIHVLKERQKTFFIIFLMICYLSAYIYDMFIHFRLAFFQIKNQIIYKNLVNYVGNQQLKRIKLYNVTTVLVGNEKQCQGYDLNHLHFYNLYFQQKLSFLIEFISDNQMGFTNGKTYLINQYKLFETIWVNAYMFLLLYKKVKL